MIKYYMTLSSVSKQRSNFIHVLFYKFLTLVFELRSNESWNFYQFFFVVLLMHLYQNMINMNIIGPMSDEEIDLDGVPPPSPELLSESRQQEVDSQAASPQGQVSKEITLSTGHIQVNLVWATVYLSKFVSAHKKLAQSQYNVDVNHHNSLLILIFKINLFMYFQFSFARNELNLDINYKIETVQLYALVKSWILCFYKRCYLIFQVENRSVGEQPPTAPSTFKLVPVSAEQEQPPPPLANPTGPSHLMSSLEQIDRQVLQSVDDHAIQVHKGLSYECSLVL